MERLSTRVKGNWQRIKKETSSRNDM